MEIEEKHFPYIIDIVHLSFSMKIAAKKYPDISEILKKKEQHRRELASLSFEKKIEIVFKLQERAKFMKSGRIA